MIGVRLDSGRLSVCRDLPEPEPAEGEAVVAPSLAGICGTDLAMIDGYAGFSGIPGHEFIGEVVEAPGRPDRIGCRGVGRITISCGYCRQCRQKRPGHCKFRRVLGIRGADGVFAERFSIPLGNIVPVPDPVPDRIGVFAEPLAAALRIVEQVRLRDADRALVIGAGILGQLVCRVLAEVGCRPVAVARHAAQQTLMEQHGIEWMPEGRGGNRRWNLVVEATGSPSGLDAALTMVRPEGTVVLKSTLAEPAGLDLTALVVNEITVVGSRCGPMETAVDWLATGRVDPTDLIEACLPLDDAQAAFARAAAPGAMKVLLHP